MDPRAKHIRAQKEKEMTKSVQNIPHRTFHKSPSQFL